MVLNLRNVIIPFQGFLFLGVLTGCEVLAIATTEVYATESVYQDPTYTGVNHYEPVILESDEEMIRVQYLDVNSYAQPEEALQLIVDHCDGSFVEIHRVKKDSRTIIEAECTEETGSHH